MFGTTRPKSARLGVEDLEGRALPAAANYFVLDFTPDYHAGSFRDTFYTVKNAAGVAPAFLDFNRDGWVTDTDVSLAATAAANRVAAFYPPFVNNAANHLSVQYGDTLANTNLGFNWIKWGVGTPAAEVAVMDFGGTSNQGLGVLGRVPQAGEGENVEGYGETYTRTVAVGLLSKAGATPADFVDKVAGTAAHELGHMMGLRHTLGNPGNVMNAYQSNAPGSTYFASGWQNTDNGYQQNTYTELDYSFQTNQRQVPAPNYSLGGQFQLAGDDAAAPPAGRLAFISQSGALVSGVIDWAQAHALGFSGIV
ncbi:MAG: hypothetical protein K2P78_14875, partial [Gemmataceae bacterium]|nr:hypothetical protein [Gemmataceae bacterium]